MFIYELSVYSCMVCVSSVLLKVKVMWWLGDLDYAFV